MTFNNGYFFICISTARTNDYILTRMRRFLPGFVSHCILSFLQLLAIVYLECQSILTQYLDDVNSHKHYILCFTKTILVENC